MAIGTGWVDGAWVDAGWVTESWSQNQDQDTAVGTVSLTLTTYPAQVSLNLSVGTVTLTLTTYPATISDGALVEATEEANAGGYLTMAERQLIQAQQDDEEALKVIYAFLEAA